MTVHARRIASVPRRSAGDTWRALCELISAPGTPARAELESVLGIAAALITEEYTRECPITISGSGPQVRIYTLHGEQAIEAQPSDELPLNHDPTAGEWTLSLPCGPNYLEEAEEAIGSAPHVEVRSTSSDDTAPAATAADRQLRRRPVIDLAALERS